MLSKPTLLPPPASSIASAQQWGNPRTPAKLFLFTPQPSPLRGPCFAPRSPTVVQLYRVEAACSGREKGGSSAT